MRQLPVDNAQMTRLIEHLGIGGNARPLVVNPAVTAIALISNTRQSGNRSWSLRPKRQRVWLAGRLQTTLARNRQFEATPAEFRERDPQNARQHRAVRRRSESGAGHCPDLDLGHQRQGPIHIQATAIAWPRWLCRTGQGDGLQSRCRSRQSPWPACCDIGKVRSTTRYSSPIRRHGMQRIKTHVEIVTAFWST